MSCEHVSLSLFRSFRVPRTSIVASRVELRDLKTKGSRNGTRDFRPRAWLPKLFLSSQLNDRPMRHPNEVKVRRTSLMEFSEYKTKLDATPENEGETRDRLEVDEAKDNVRETVPATTPREYPIPEPFPLTTCIPCPQTGGHLGNSIQCWRVGRFPLFPLTCMLGADAPCAAVTYALVIVSWSLFSILKARTFGLLGRIFTFTLAVSHLLALMMVSLSDPGIVPKRNMSELQLDKLRDNGHRVCPWCKIVRSEGVQHCYACDVCVLDLDHHCP